MNYSKMNFMSNSICPSQINSVSSTWKTIGKDCSIISCESDDDIALVELASLKEFDGGVCNNQVIVRSMRSYSYNYFKTYIDINLCCFFSVNFYMILSTLKLMHRERKSLHTKIFLKKNIVHFAQNKIKVTRMWSVSIPIKETSKDSGKFYYRTTALSAFRSRPSWSQPIIQNHLDHYPVRERRIPAQSAFLASFDALKSEWSWISSLPDKDPENDSWSGKWGKNKSNPQI